MTKYTIQFRGHHGPQAFIVEASDIQQAISRFRSVMGWHARIISIAK